MLTRYFGSGLGPMAMGGSLNLVVVPSQSFQTQLLDFTISTMGIEIIPAVLGHVPRIQNARFVLQQVAGTQTTPLTSRAGSDELHSNYFPSSSVQPSNAVVNAASTPCISGSNTAAALTSKLFPNTPVYFDITAGAQGTGGFVLRGKFHVQVLWLPVGSQ